MDHDVLPQSQQARAILAVIELMRNVGIDADLDCEFVTVGESQVFRPRLLLAPLADTHANREALVRCTYEVLQYQQATLQAIQAMMRAKRTGAPN